MMRNSAHVPLLDVMREAHRFARSIGATDEDLGYFEDLGIPSGELTVCYGKSPFLMGKSTISMAIFNSYVSSPEGMEVS